MFKYFLSLIIPAFNEEKKIERDIRAAFTYFNKAGIYAEVIVSTDGVTDRTNDIVEKLMKEFKDLKLIKVPQRIGKGVSIKKGVIEARGRYIMFADAGLCVPFRYIKSGLDILNRGYDIALASRAGQNSKILKPQPVYRKVGAGIFKFLIRVVLGAPRNIEDSQCGFKLYKAQVAKDLYSKLKTKKMMFDLEIILRAKKRNYRMMQFPVVWTNDDDTKFHPVFGTIDNLKELWAIKFIYKL